MNLATLVGVGGCLGLVIAAPACGEDLKVAEFDFIRLQASIGAAAAPDVKEDTKDGAGVNTSYDWNGGRDNGYQAAITALFGRGKLGEGGWEWGGEFVMGIYDLTPQDFTVDGVVFGNGSGSELRSRTYGINLLGGWQWGLMDLDEFTGFVEIIPHIGGGIATAESEVHNGNGSYSRESGTGAYFDAGLRLGAYITEKRMIYGVNVSYDYGYSKIDIDFPGGYSSELELKRHGFGIAGVVGYRF